MSDAIELGESDGESRWIGIKRHQAVLAIAGVALVGDWLTRSSGHSLEGMVGLVLIVATLPAADSLTTGQWAWRLATYVARSHWTTVVARGADDAIVLQGRGRVRIRGYRLQHRGRLDLSGRDFEVARAIASLTDTIATGDEHQHLSLHVCRRDASTATLLAVPDHVSPPEGWDPDNVLALEVAGLGSKRTTSMLLERLTYVRDATGPARVLRVKDFSSPVSGVGLLDALQSATSSLDVALHIDVVAARRAHRLASRAVHRLGSDEVTALGAGFRRTARASRSLERLRQREVLVVSGRSLLRIAVYVVVRATSVDRLSDEVDVVLRRAHESGLRMERGLGRQATWYCHQLPGGPGW